MYQLKNNGHIENMIFSVYLKMKEGNTTHIKFGGYDAEGIEGEDVNNLKFLKTRKSDTWSIEMQSSDIAGTSIFAQGASSSRYAQLELAYPYIHVPISDFTKIAAAFNKLYGTKKNPVCNTVTMNCLFTKPCDEVPIIEGGYLQVNLTDSDGKVVKIELDRKSQFLAGNHINETLLGENTCFIPVFGQKSLVDQWYLGNIVLSEYYTVFDMTPVDNGEDYIRVGIAKANPSDEVGLSLLDKISKELTKSSLGVFLLILLSLILVGAILFCLYRKRSTNREVSFGETKFVEYGCNYEDAINIHGLKKNVALNQVLQEDSLKAVDKGMTINNSNSVSRNLKGFGQKPIQ